MTKEALTFDKIWHRLEPYIKGQAVVAHNGLSFDFPVLEKRWNIMVWKIPSMKNIVPIVFLNKI